jgi:hypothetical protein
MMAILGMSFIGCALLLAGLPPLSGFLAKFAMLVSLLGPKGGSVPTTSWALIPAHTPSDTDLLKWRRIRWVPGAFWRQPCLGRCHARALADPCRP